LNEELTNPRLECYVRLSIRPIPSPCDRPYRLGLLWMSLTPAYFLPIVIPSVRWLNLPLTEEAHRPPKFKYASLDPRHSFKPRWNPPTLTQTGFRIQTSIPRHAGLQSRLPFLHFLTGLNMRWGACEAPCGLVSFSVYASTILFYHPSTWS